MKVFVNHLNEKDIHDLKEIFMKIDKDNTGLIRPNELAEAMKVPRLLESGPNSPLVYPNGGKGYDFYFQEHFEQLFEKIYSQ